MGTKGLEDSEEDLEEVTPMISSKCSLAEEWVEWEVWEVWEVWEAWEAWEVEVRNTPLDSAETFIRPINHTVFVYIFSPLQCLDLR